MAGKTIFHLTIIDASSYTRFVSGGNNSVVECNLPKVEVASSNLVSRSKKYKGLG